MLPEAHQTLVPWLGGHGSSWGPNACYGTSFVDEVARLAGWLESFDSAPMQLVGYSLGARLALGLAALLPDRIAQLHLVSGRRGLDSTEQRAERRQADEHWASQLETRPLETVLADWFAQPLFRSLGTVAPAELAAEQLERRRAAPQGLAHAMRSYGLAEMPSYREAWTTLRCPVQLIVGAEDQRFRALAAGLVEELPHARLRVVDGAGHHLPLQAPGALARELARGASL